MPDLKTDYMGIELKNPIVVAACSISNMIDRIRLAQRAGAGALVIRSLFEEQIQINAMKLKHDLSIGSESFAEALSYFPDIEFGEAEEHLMWVEKTRQEVDMPLIASLNADTPGSWIHYARKLEATGVDGIELNIYSLPTDINRTGMEIEAELYDIVSAVQSEVTIPVSVKLSPFYTSISNVVAELDQRGVKALVLFNRFLQPDIDVQTEQLISEMILSTGQELRLPLRWTALLYGRIGCQIALNTGVHSGLDVAKALLAGATVVQTASALLKNGIPYLSTMLRELEEWMQEHEYESVAAFRGRLSQKESDDPFTFERAQYVHLLRDQK
jgi:dihydroorotate dehydrogenase (fumarate)